MTKNKSQHTRDQALSLFKKRGGILRTSEAIAAGIHSRILYELRDSGLIEQISRGLYSLPNLNGVDFPDFVTVSKLVPEGVICLISALYFHELTLQMPKRVDVAVQSRYTPPKIDYPPVKFHWFSDDIYKAGIETHKLDGVNISVYSKEKTIVDCFRLRAKVGLEVAIEALKFYFSESQIDVQLLHKFAKLSRVSKIMKPYIEVLLHDQS